MCDSARPNCARSRDHLMRGVPYVLKISIIHAAYMGYSLHDSATALSQRREIACEYICRCTGVYIYIYIRTRAYMYIYIHVYIYIYM